MLRDVRSILRTTFEGLENGLCVWNIATFPLLTCNLEDSVATVFNDPKWKTIDCIPVKKGDAVVGVAERPPELMPVTINKVMRPLSEEILVASRMPLKEFLPKMLERPSYRLVLQGTKVSGIVTRSDIQKLPVRIVAFGLVTHLEMSMTELILTTYPKEEDWLIHLNDGRRARLEDRFHSLCRKGLDVSKLEATEFCDKRSIVRRIFGFSKSQVEELQEIEHIVRDILAHAGKYAESDESLKDFLALLDSTERWIEKIESKIWPPSDESMAL